MLCLKCGRYFSTTNMACPYCCGGWARISSNTEITDYCDICGQYHAKGYCIYKIRKL